MALPDFSQFRFLGTVLMRGEVGWGGETRVVTPRLEEGSLVLQRERRSPYTQRGVTDHLEW